MKSSFAALRAAAHTVSPSSAGATLSRDVSLAEPLRSTRLSRGRGEVLRAQRTACVAGGVLMLSIGKLVVGQQRYYEQQVAQGRDDDYSGRGEAPGE